MATIKLNNIHNASDLICLNTCPTIISVTNTSTDTFESVTVDINGLAPKDVFLTTKITVNGYTISGSDDITKIKSRVFYHYGQTDNDINAEFCAISIVNALKTVPQLSMNYNIVYDGEGKFSITAKNGGIQYALSLSTTNLENFDIINKTVGSTTDNMRGQYFSKVYLDLYYNSDERHRKINSPSEQTEYKYLTTLQKEYFKDKVNFNVSPVLQTVSNNDDTTIWKGRLYSVVDGVTTELGVIDNNYVINGYLVNQGNTYINASVKEGQTLPALNVGRGSDKPQYNKSIMYIYDPEFRISLYGTYGKTYDRLTVDYLESDETVIKSQVISLNLSSTKNLGLYIIRLDKQTLRNSYYVDLTFSFGTIRLNVINPPNANVECNRVWWYNSYGGVSFFDFVGDKDEERTTDVETYNKSLLDFYTSRNQEQEIIYKRTNNVTVTLSSHIIEKDGLYQLYDLQNSYKAWVTINGVNYSVIIESLTIDEPSDGVYIAKIKYKYSLLDSFA